MRAPTNSSAKQNEYNWMGTKEFPFPAVRIKMVVLGVSFWVALSPVVFGVSTLLLSLTAPWPVAIIVSLIIGGVGGGLLSAALTKAVSRRIDTVRPVRFVLAQLVGELHTPRGQDDTVYEHETPTKIPKAFQEIEHETDTKLWETSEL